MIEQVLDHGYVELIESWGTGRRPTVDALGQVDYEIGIIEAARQSTQGTFRGWERDQKLLQFLLENKHDTPFEFAGMALEIQAPIFVFREWHRHRTQCLAGNTQLVFDLPKGSPHYLNLKDVVRRWNAPLCPRSGERASRTKAQFEQARIGAMQLRSPQGYVSIVDAWYSGEKQVYRLSTRYGEVTASADHAFNTPDGAVCLRDSPRHVLAMVQTGAAVVVGFPQFTEDELRHEEWRSIPFCPRYEVSNLGRVRSLFNTRGRRQKVPLLKVVTNSQGRGVVGLGGNHVYQVSHLVYAAFVGARTCHVLHKNDNALDNRLANLYHGTDKDNAADRIRNGIQTALRTVPVEVLSIKAVGREDTFDISVSGNHWFNANGLVVHNSYNEMSARYTPLPDLYYLPQHAVVMERAHTATTNRQAQGIGGVVLEAEACTAWLESVAAFYAEAERLYQTALSAGVPKELARITMPVGHYSRMRASACLRNWLAFLILRDHPKAQWEIRQLAAAVNKIATAIFPQTMSVWQAMRKEGAVTKEEVTRLRALLARIRDAATVSTSPMAEVVLELVKEGLP